MPTVDPTTLLKRDVLGRVTLPAAQREALLDEFDRSGMKGQPFAKLLGVNYPTFASWIQKRRRARGDYATPAQSAQPLTAIRPAQKIPANATLRLVEVVTTPELPTVTAPPLTAAAAPPLTAAALPLKSQAVPALEVRLPGGASLLVSDAAQAGLAAQILRFLHTSC
jgi:hypothetical protein